MVDKYVEFESFLFFGLFDYVIVIVVLKVRDVVDNIRMFIIIRDIWESKKVSLGWYLCNIDWVCVYN